MDVKRTVMSVLVIIALLCWSVIGFGAGRKAPDFRLKTLDGSTIKLSDNLHRGPIMVDFWATWCVPCLKEMVHFQKLYEEYHDRGFEIYGISIDNPRTASKIKPMVKSKGFTFPILLDPNKEVLKKFGGRNVIPYTVILSPNGEIVATYEGYKAGNEKIVEKEILKYLADVPADNPESEGGTE